MIAGREILAARRLDGTNDENHGILIAKRSHASVPGNGVRRWDRNAGGPMKASRHSGSDRTGAAFFSQFRRGCLHFFYSLPRKDSLPLSKRCVNTLTYLTSPYWVWETEDFFWKARSVLRLHGQPHTYVLRRFLAAVDNIARSSGLGVPKKAINGKWQQDGNAQSSSSSCEAKTPPFSFPNPRQRSQYPRALSHTCISTTIPTTHHHHLPSFSFSLPQAYPSPAIPSNFSLTSSGCTFRPVKSKNPLAILNQLCF